MKIENSIYINASPERVWEYLTNPYLMKKWMGDAEMEIKVNVDWKAGNPIITTGFHHVRFQNKGTILRYEPFEILQYTQLNSVSRLPDTQENHTIITFQLRPMNARTQLLVALNNFPTETIYKHLDFYWKATPQLIKELVEQKVSDENSGSNSDPASSNQ